MKKSTEYKENQIIGDNNIKFIKEVEPHIYPRGGKRKKALFECHCGNRWITTMTHVRTNGSKSCGCIKKPPPINMTHGLSKHPLYLILNSIIQRCYNKNDKSFKIYGGRGITVCEEWKNDFKAFYDWAMGNGYKKGLSIDRIDNDGNYEPSNCRWTTNIIQSRNQRKRGGTGSKYIGVNRSKKRWESSINVNKKRVRFGVFDTEFEAARARDQYIVDNSLVGFIMNNVL